MWDWLGTLNPFGLAGDALGKAAADGWSGIMLAIWSAGLFVLRMILSMMDKFMTPDISAGGPAAGVYRTTFWCGAALVVIMALIQLGVAGFRRDGMSLARVGIGVAQFAIVWGAWISYGVAVLAACGGLSRALMSSLLKVNSWSQWSPMPEADTFKSGLDVTTATVLGLLGLFLWLAAIGHFVIMMTRAAALLILTATAPISAAGLVSEAGRAWFWKSLRWFHAAAFTPVLSVLVMGIGVQITTGVAQSGASSSEKAIGTALPGVMLILVAVVAPVALFRLLAFVDPGTSSGAAMRAGMAGMGGIQGLLGGGAGGASGTSSAATASGGSGSQSQGEAQSSEATASKFGQAFSMVGGPAGAALSAGIGVVMKAGATAAAVGTDEMNQTAVGDSSYFPDYQRGDQRFNPDQRDSDNSGNDARQSGDNTPPSASMPHMPTPPSTGGDGGGMGGPSAAGGKSGGAAAGGEGAAAAGAIPPIV